MRGATKDDKSFKDTLKFQSTRPMRGATFSSSFSSIGSEFQSTRPMRGATALELKLIPAQLNFNPRAPCGARPKLTNLIGLHYQFQSTRPMRGATPETGHPGHSSQQISIHAPHAGRDLDC